MNPISGSREARRLQDEIINSVDPDPSRLLLQLSPLLPSMNLEKVFWSRQRFGHPDTESSRPRLAPAQLELFFRPSHPESSSPNLPPNHRRPVDSGPRGTGMQPIHRSPATRSPIVCSVVLTLVFLPGAAPALAQVLVQGRLEAVDQTAPDERLPLSTILATTSRPGPGSEPSSFRTWETHPAGWFRLSGPAGRHTIAFTNPAHFMRPEILTNQFLRDGDSIELRPRSRFDFTCFQDGAWDPKPARRYWQPFFARGTGITAVGFKLATDGVDGAGPGKQDVLISIHRRKDSDPSDWPRVGPVATAVGVDCGGPKSYWYSVGWNSGEVPTEPGQEYAVSIRPKSSDGQFQTFWRKRRGGSPGIHRIGTETRGFEPYDAWLAVSSDGDGLVIPYNKRVHRKFNELTTLEKVWSQTWIAKGRGLASVVLYAAVSGKQPPLARQRVRVRVRKGGPGGPVVGTEKIGVGNGNYTGDASWGHFVAIFAPGEAPLEPGQKYAIEFESIESLHTVGGFVNIKGQESDGRAGFNPYRKCPPDEYPGGTAYRRSTEECDFDLDLQIVEYEHDRADWADALAGRNLLANALKDSPDENGWSSFKKQPAGTDLRSVKLAGKPGQSLRISSADPAHPIDGGWRQKIEGLSSGETYVLRGRVRSTWPASVDHACQVGFDPTGQTEDPDASTIEWTVLPERHGEFLPYRSPPIRPRTDGVSLWLRARCTREDPRFPFRADFDGFTLHRVDTGVPVPDRRTAREGFIDRIPPEKEDARIKRLELVRARRKHTPVLVHRGATRFAPENTLAAFSAALDRGADGFEVDIRQSRDGVLYVFHDDRLDRTTNRTGSIHGLSYFDLLGCDVGGQNHRIPTLAAVFTLARDRGALLHLDVKEPRLEPEILRLIEEADLWEHVVEVNAGNARTIRHHERIELLTYKGWFPLNANSESELASARKRFLEQPGNMIFTKWDPLDAVESLGRTSQEASPFPVYLLVNREGDT